MKTHFKIILGVSVFIIVFLFPFLARAATLELVLEKEIVSPKEDIAVLVSVNSEGQDVNTAQATIFFPANLLQVVKVDNTNSVFSFWLKEPVFDNNKGTIIFVGGSTSGFSGPNLKLMRVAFKVKGSGTGEMGVNDGAITASDGTGSNVYTTSKGLAINIPSTADFEAVKIEQANKAATLAKELPAELGFSLPFYPDPTKWNNRSASFRASWSVTSDTIGVGVSIDQNPNSIPVASPEALSGSKIFSALADGVWYLHLRVKNNIGWSSTLHYRIALDTMPPSPFKINSDDGQKTNEPRPTIRFATTDLTSGVDNYAIRLDGSLVANTSADTYKFDPLLPGVHNINVSATDKAGNTTSETQAIEILPIASPVITYASRSAIVNEGGITAGGTALPGVNIIVQIQNNQKQIVSEQIVPVDDSGNWNVAVNKGLAKGNYNLLATARDKNMASSFPAVSETINVKQRPVLALGNLEISQTWFFIDLIIVLLASFGMGYFTYHKWRNKLDKRVVIAERDVMNVFNYLEQDIEKLLKIHTGDNQNEKKDVEAAYILKDMKENLEKSRRYVVDNVREINE